MTTPLRQLCTFFLDDRMFGFDVLRVQEINRIQQLTPVPLAPPAVRGLINLRGQIVTAIDLRERLGFPAADPNSLPVNIIVPSDEGPVSFLVDEVGDVIDVDDRDFEAPGHARPGRQSLHPRRLQTFRSVAARPRNRTYPSAHRVAMIDRATPCLGCNA